MTLESSISELKGVGLIYPEVAQESLSSDDSIHLFIGDILKKNFVFARGISKSRMIQAGSSANISKIITQLALNHRVIIHVAREEQACVEQAEDELITLSCWHKIQHNLKIRPELVELLKDFEGIQLYDGRIPPGPNAVIHVIIGQLRGKNTELCREIPLCQMLRIKSSTSAHVLANVLQILTTYWSVSVHVDQEKKHKLASARAILQIRPLWNEIRAKLTLPS